MGNKEKWNNIYKYDQTIDNQFKKGAKKDQHRIDKKIVLVLKSFKKNMTRQYTSILKGQNRTSLASLVAQSQTISTACSTNQFNSIFIF